MFVYKVRILRCCSKSKSSSSLRQDCGLNFSHALNSNFLEQTLYFMDRLYLVIKYPPDFLLPLYTILFSLLSFESHFSTVFSGLLIFFANSFNLFPGFCLINFNRSFIPPFIPPFILPFIL